jgi:hypothetical protein
VPTSQTTAQTWKYRTTAPLADWTASNYNDSAWSSGSGGFGANDPPNTAGLIRTSWNTADIWLRRTFNPGSLLPADQQSVLHHLSRRDVEIYVNASGGSATGYTTSYGLLR